MSSLSVYAFSFFKALLGIISSLKSLFIIFFLGGSEDIRKIPWVGWNNICLQKDYGGLVVREFNIALLGK